MTEILSLGEIEQWLRGRSEQTSIQIALRNALRLIPLAHNAAALPDSNTAMATLACMRACLVSQVALDDRSSAIQGAAYDAHHFARSNMSDRFGSPAVEAAAIAAFTVYCRAGFAEAASGLRVFTDHKDRRLRNRPLQEPLKELSDVPAFFASADIGKLERGEELREVVLPKAISNFVDSWASHQNNILDRVGPWSFWSRWYERAMAGDPLPWHLQREIALIDDEVWEQGPKAVAEQIVEIEAEWRRKQAQVTADQARSLMRQAKAHVLQASGLQPLVQMAIDAYRREVSNQLPDALEPLEQLPPILNEIANILSADQPATEKEADLQKVLSLMAGTVSTLNQKLRDANAEIGALKQAQDDASPRRLFAEAFYTKAGEGAAGLLTSKVMWGGVLSVSALFLGTDADALASSLGECAQTVIEQNSPSEAVAPAIQLPPLQ